MADINNKDNHVSKNGHMTSKSEKCSKHHKSLKYYCVDDDISVCSACAIFDHRKCREVDLVPSAACIDSCDRLKDKLDKVLNETNQVIDVLHEAEERVSRDTTTVLEDISKFKEMILGVFDTTCNNITGERDDLTRTLQEFKDVLEIIKDFMMKLNCMKDSKRIIIDRGLKDEIDIVIDKTNKLREQLKTFNFKYKFDTHLEKLTDKLISMVEPGDKDLKMIQKLKLDAKKIDMKSKVNGLLLKTFNIENINLEQPMYCGYDFLPDGRLVVIDNSNRKVIVFDSKFVSQKTYVLPLQVLPLGVAVITDREVIVTTGDHLKLYILDIDQSGLITLNRKISVTRSYNSISKMSDDKFVVSTIGHKTPFCMVTLSGKEKKFKFNIHEKRSPVATTKCTYLEQYNKLIFTDSSDSKVYIYDIISGECKVVNEWTPTDVCVGLHDHVYVCCQKNGIQVLSHTGDLVSTITVDMTGPRYIVTSQDKQTLLVANREKCSLYQVLVL